MPYVQGVSDGIARILRKSTSPGGKQARKWKLKLMAGVKDKVEEADRSGVVYALECNDCERTYVGETGRSVKTRAKEHQAHARNGRIEISATAEHAWRGHSMDWTPIVLAS